MVSGFRSTGAPPVMCRHRRPACATKDKRTISPGLCMSRNVIIVNPLETVVGLVAATTVAPAPQRRIGPGVNGTGIVQGGMHGLSGGLGGHLTNDAGDHLAQTVGQIKEGLL